MTGNKTVLQVFFGIILVATGIPGALAEYEPNDNYSSLVLSYQSTTFANPVCVGNDCHTGLSGPAAVYSRQIMPNLALGLSGSYLQSSGNSSTLKSTGGSVFAKVIAGISRNVDVGASLAALFSTTERCSINPDTCTSIRDTGTDVGVFGKVFLNDSKSLSLALSYDSIAYQKAPNQSVVVLSLVSVLAKHHRLALSVDRVRDSGGNAISGGYGLGYTYLVF